MNRNFAKEPPDFVNVIITKHHLNFNELHALYSWQFYKKNFLNFGKTNLHSTYIKFTENLPNFCETNLLNVYRWQVEPSRTFTHCIYHIIDTYDDCHIQNFSLKTHGRSIDIFQQFKYPIKFDRACNKTLQERIYMSVMGLSRASMAQHFLV
jgi:hypothetical protein